MLKCIASFLQSEKLTFSLEIQQVLFCINFLLHLNNVKMAVKVQLFRNQVNGVTGVNWSGFLLTSNGFWGRTFAWKFIWHVAILLQPFILRFVFLFFFFIHRLLQFVLCYLVAHRLLVYLLQLVSVTFLERVETPAHVTASAASVCACLTYLAPSATSANVITGSWPAEWDVRRVAATQLDLCRNSVTRYAVKMLLWVRSARR